jgi:hypothetical protein
MRTEQRSELLGGRVRQPAQPTSANSPPAVPGSVIAGRNAVRHQVDQSQFLPGRPAWWDLAAPLTEAALRAPGTRRQLA